jgi:hypothetical protein
MSWDPRKTNAEPRRELLHLRVVRLPNLASADVDDLIAFAAGGFVPYKLRRGVALTGEPL